MKLQLTLNHDQAVVFDIYISMLIGAGLGVAVASGIIALVYAMQPAASGAAIGFWLACGLLGLIIAIILRWFIAESLAMDLVLLEELAPKPHRPELAKRPRKAKGAKKAKKV